MDVVEAIDAWIDEEIDDLTDDELESILEILDVLSTSDLGSLDADDIYDDDIHEMVDHVGGSAADRAFTIAVLRAALFDESFDGYLDAADEDSKSSNEDPDDDRGADSSFLDDLENAHLLDTEPGDTEPEIQNSARQMMLATTTFWLTWLTLCPPPRQNS